MGGFGGSGRLDVDHRGADALYQSQNISSDA
jgi:hypothetical protein